MGDRDTEKELTLKEIAEYLRMRKQILLFIRKRINVLTKEYEDTEELIRELQLSSPQMNALPSSTGSEKGLDSICIKYMQKRNEYQIAVYEEIQQLAEMADRVEKVYLCFRDLPDREKIILQALYLDNRSYKELEGPGMSSRTIDRIRKQGLMQIKIWCETYYTGYHGKSRELLGQDREEAQK